MTMLSTRTFDGADLAVWQNVMRLGLIAAMILRFAAIALIALAATKALAEPGPGIVTFTFDDGSASQHDLGLALARNYGIRGTLFLPTAMVNSDGARRSNDWLMSWDEIRDFHYAGWEIGAHGRSHIRLTELDPYQLETELVGPILEIKRNIGVAPVSFSSPFGAFDERTIERIMQEYKYHLSWKGHAGRNPVQAIDPRFIGRFEVVREMSAAEVCGEMVLASMNNVWLVLLFHGIVERDPSEYQVSTLLYEEILACAHQLANKGVIDILPVREAMQAIERRY